MNYQLLIAEDDAAMSGLLAELAREEGFLVQVCSDGKQAYDVLINDPPDALLADVQMPMMNGIELIEEANTACPGLPVAIITGYATVPDVVRAFRAGAIDLITKPFENQDVRSVLKKFNRTLDREQRIEILTERLLRIENNTVLPVSNSRVMQKTMQLLDKVSMLDTPVLLNGETGTGKGVLAQIIHTASPRHENAIFDVNCGALSDSIAESELFGHEKGAFTGANARKRGVLELAHGGTLFLDEINSASMAIQTRLLEFIQERTIRRVGGEQKIPVDVRLVFAANDDLEALTKKGTFREDLWYRLNVFPVDVPSLRDRREDVLHLAENFLIEKARELARPTRELSEEVEQLLLSYHWPGNVRELENCIHRAVVLAEGHVIERQHLTDAIIGSKSSMAKIDLAPDASLAEVEAHWIKHMLSRCKENKSEASRRLGIDVSTLHRKLREFK